jgi:hypothetical protein
VLATRRGSDKTNAGSVMAHYCAKSVWAILTYSLTLITLRLMLKYVDGPGLRSERVGHCDIFIDAYNASADAQICEWPSQSLRPCGPS